MIGFYDYTVVVTYISLISSIMGMFFAIDGKLPLAVFCLAFSGLCDMFDGKIARKFNQVSNLGKILDPIADKLSQMAIVIVLLYTYWENPIKYLFFFFIVKEVLMLLGLSLIHI